MVGNGVDPFDQKAVEITAVRVAIWGHQFDSPSKHCSAGYRSTLLQMHTAEWSGTLLVGKGWCMAGQEGSGSDWAQYKYPKRNETIAFDRIPFNGTRAWGSIRISCCSGVNDVKDGFNTMPREEKGWAQVDKDTQHTGPQENQWSTGQREY